MTDLWPMRIPATILGVYLCATGIGAAAEDGRTEALRKAIEATRRQLADEKARMAREEEGRARKLERLETKRKQLSDEVVQLKLDVSRLTSVEATTQRELEGLAEGSTKRHEDLARLRRTLAEALDRLAGHLKSLVPSSGRKAQLGRVAEVRADLEQSGVDAATVGRFLSLLCELLDEARTSEQYEAEIRTARGVKNRVTMLRVGHVAAAYLAPGGAVGFALRAPEGEGLRWKEALPRSRATAIRHAAEALERGGTQVAVFPADVTRALADEIQYGTGGWWGRLSAGGVVMVPLALVAVLAVVLIVERLRFFAREGRASEGHAATVLARCERGDLAEAQSYCEQKRGPVARALGACLQHKARGVAAMEDGVQEAILHELPRLERFLSTLSILGTVAPLLGLLGTVTGMIRTFDMITMHGSGEPRLMAGGISEALTTTATGLVIAIPILLAHNMLSGKMEKLIADTERFAASLLVLLQERGLAPPSAQTNDAALQADAARTNAEERDA